MRLIKVGQRATRIAVVAAVVTLGAGCSSGTADSGAASAGGTTLAVVATTPEIADFVRNIGGSDVAVTQIIKPNVDPHDYEPTPADLQAIAERTSRKA